MDKTTVLSGRMDGQRYGVLQDIHEKVIDRRLGRECWYDWSQMIRAWLYDTVIKILQEKRLYSECILTISHCGF